MSAESISQRALAEIQAISRQAALRVRRKPWDQGQSAWTWGYCAQETCSTHGLQVLSMRSCHACQVPLTPALLCACGEAVQPRDAIAQLKATGIAKLCNLCQRELDERYLGHLMAVNLKAMLLLVEEQAAISEPKSLTPTYPLAHGRL